MARARWRGLSSLSEQDRVDKDRGERVEGTRKGVKRDGAQCRERREAGAGS
jgi:hypothetical protein